jgi:hypothetical protein
MLQAYICQIAVQLQCHAVQVVYTVSMVIETLVSMNTNYDNHEMKWS